MIFDAHSDLLIDLTNHRRAGERNVFHERHSRRLKTGQVEGAILVFWPEPEYSQDPWGRILEIMQATAEEVREDPELRIVRDLEEIRQAKQEGAFYAILGLEGMAGVGDDPERLGLLYEFGVRHAMLTWNDSNQLAAGAMSGNGLGLTGAGKQTVRAIQDRNMILDVSHLNEAGFWDVASLAVAPFIASHSNASALCPVPRNLSDEQLRLIRDVKGIVGINAYRSFLDPVPERQTVRRLAEHAAHMIDVMGIDHVSCGFDFLEFLDDPGNGKNPNALGMKDASETAALFEAFDEMGMSAEEKEKIACGNLQRIVRECLR